MSDFKFIDARICDVVDNDGVLSICVVLKVQCKDFLIDESSSKIIRGNCNVINDYLYKLVFNMSNDKNIDKCPNCFAKLDDKGSNVKCHYCGSIIKRKSNNLVLSDKKMLYQYIIK